jgi:multidrug efflux pump subunit AcrB
MPEGVSITVTEEAATLANSQQALSPVLEVAILVVFLVLAVQFESVASAVVIILKAPFGLSAALLAISLTSGSLNY